MTQKAKTSIIIAVLFSTVTGLAVYNGAVVFPIATAAMGIALITMRWYPLMSISAAAIIVASVISIMTGSWASSIIAALAIAIAWGAKLITKTIQERIIDNKVDEQAAEMQKAYQSLQQLLQLKQELLEEQKALTKRKKQTNVAIAELQEALGLKTS